MNQERPLTESQGINPDVVIDAIRRIRYGSVLVKVHQGKITEYEVTEKKRD